MGGAIAEVYNRDAVDQHGGATFRAAPGTWVATGGMYVGPLPHFFISSHEILIFQMVKLHGEYSISLALWQFWPT